VKESKPKNIVGKKRKNFAERNPEILDIPTTSYSQKRRKVLIREKRKSETGQPRRQNGKPYF